MATGKAVVEGLGLRPSALIGAVQDAAEARRVRAS